MTLNLLKVVALKRIAIGLLIAIAMRLIYLKTFSSIQPFLIFIDYFILWWHRNVKRVRLKKQPSDKYMLKRFLFTTIHHI
jgi:hypothetical protein